MNEKRLWEVSIFKRWGDGGCYARKVVLAVTAEEAQEIAVKNYLAVIAKDYYGSAAALTPLEAPEV